MQDKINVLFVCWGNICRSPMAEFVLKDLVDKEHLSNCFHIESSAISDEEHGNPVYPPARAELSAHGIDCSGKYARQSVKSDYKKFDYILVMEDFHKKSLNRIFGSDKDGKVHTLLEYTSNPRNISDPWYTGKFSQTYADILEGCTGFLGYLKETGAV